MPLTADAIKLTINYKRLSIFISYLIIRSIKAAHYDGGSSISEKARTTYLTIVKKLDETGHKVWQYGLLVSSVTQVVS